MQTIKLPRRFFIDHLERDLDTPRILRETKSHVYVSAADPALAELASDADYYKDPQWFDREYFGLCMSAKATLKALKEAGVA